jgi:ribosomal protein L18E
VQVLLFHEEEKEEEVVVVVGVVVGMEYLVSLADAGMQVFLFFQD